VLSIRSVGYVFIFLSSYIIFIFIPFLVFLCHSQSTYLFLARKKTNRQAESYGYWMDEWVTNGQGNQLTRLLTHLQTMNWDDIAKKCNTTPGAASKRYSRMKQAFDSGAAAPTPAKKEVAEGGRKRKRAEGSKAKSKDKSEDKSEVDSDVDSQDADEDEGEEDEEVVKNEKHEVKNEEKKEEKVKAETKAEVKEEKKPKPKPKVKEEEPVPISEKKKKEMFEPKRRALARIANLKNKVAVSLKEMHTEVMAGVSDDASSTSASASASEEEEDESEKEDGPQPPPAKKRALAPAAKTTTTEDNLAQKSDMSANKIIDIDGNEHEVLALAHSLPNAQLLAELEATVRKAAPGDAQAMLGEPADAQFYSNGTTEGQTENSNDELTQSRKYFLLNWVLRLIGY
jgi:hypothetical protein